MSSAGIAGERRGNVAGLLLLQKTTPIKCLDIQSTHGISKSVKSKEKKKTKADDSFVLLLRFELMEAGKLKARIHVDPWFCIIALTASRGFFFFPLCVVCFTRHPSRRWKKNYSKSETFFYIQRCTDAASQVRV